MKRSQWRAWTDSGTAHARAAGRRRYNAQRQRAAAERRARVERVMLALMQERLDEGRSFYGLKTQIAEALGVHRATVARDLRHNFWMRTLTSPCPTCARPMARDELRAKVAAMAARLRATYPELA